MDKQQIIAFIQEQLAAQKISQEDLLQLTSINSIPQVSQPLVTKETDSKRLVSIFYGIGAIIVIMGVVIFIAQYWNTFGFLGQFLVTCGISFATYVAGFLLIKPEQKTLSQVFFVISAVLAPLGLYVLLDQVGIEITFIIHLMIACVLSIIYGAALLLTKKNILVLLVAAFITWGYYALILETINSFLFDNNDLLKWATMLIGVAYIFVGYGYISVMSPSDDHDKKEKKSIQNVFYGLGALGILSAGIFIGGFFNLIYILILFGAFYGSVYLKSRAMLVFASLFFMAHIIKITAEYFFNSISWPILLIFVGFLVIGIGYATFYINKNFISSK